MIPALMKAAQVKHYGDIEEMISVSKDNAIATPNLESDKYEPTERIHPLIQMAAKEDRKTHMIIKTLAVALAPGDCRVLSGKTRFFQGPPSFPYIPGGDCCGIVVQTQKDESYFQIGDLVAARFTVAPRDAMAEYARVSTTVCEKIDISNRPTENSQETQLTPEAIAALASASPAVCLSDYIRPNERILVLGAGGGIGSHFCQLAKQWKGASYVCGVSQDPSRLLDHPICCDDAIDYTNESIFESTKFQMEPFDTIVDLASGGWPALVDAVHSKKLPSIVKPASQGGRFLTLTIDTPTFQANTLWQLLSLFLVQPFWRRTWSRLVARRTLPEFVKVNGLPEDRAVLTRTLKLAKEGKVTAVVDGSYPFSTNGVQQAFRTVQSRHAKGKVVVQIQDDVGK